MTDRRPATDNRATTSHLENFKWPYLHEGSSDPLHVWFYGGVFEDGGSNGAISGFPKSKMRSRHLEKFKSFDLLRVWF